MNNFADSVKSLNDLIVKGEMVEAMEFFYAEAVEMQENEEPPRKGKDFCIEHERKTLEKVKQIKSRLLNQAIDIEKSVVFSEWEFIFIYKNDRAFKLTEVSVQQWLDEKIIKEKFYYKEFKEIETTIEK